jgi:putative addiction module antidote
MMELKIIQMGNSLGVILPKRLLEEMNVAKGDRLAVDRRGDGWRVAPFEVGYDIQMSVANIIMKRRRKLLKLLAKA